MEDSFKFRQMQKLQSTLGEEEPEPEDMDAPALEPLVDLADPEPREAIVARAQAALQRVAELVAQHPELAAMVEEIRRQEPAAPEA